MQVDRSAAYAARWVAKSVVAAGLARRCLFQVAYAIGVAKPLSIYVDTYGTATGGRSDGDVLAIIEKNFDLRPGAIIKELNLLRPIYSATAVGGHFGRTEDWCGGARDARALGADCAPGCRCTWEKPKKLDL